MPKNKKLKGDLVYSTNPDLMLRLSQEKPIITPPPHQQDLKVWIDRKQRKGKVATLITGFVGSDDNLTALARLLKTKCGVGGSAKDGEILIQGDIREKVMEILTQEGYKVKKRQEGNLVFQRMRIPNY